VYRLVFVVIVQILCVFIIVIISIKLIWKANIILIILIIAVLCLCEQMYASSSANHTDDFSDGNFEVKSELIETADNPLDDETSKVSDDVVSGGEKMDIAEFGKQRSFVWKHFFARGNSASCNLCGKVMKRTTGNTTNLLKHLQRDHRKEYAAVMEATGRRMMEEASRNMVCAN